MTERDFLATSFVKMSKNMDVLLVLISCMLAGEQNCCSASGIRQLTIHCEKTYRERRGFTVIIIHPCLCTF